MFCTVFQSTVSIFDLHNSLKKRRRQKLGFGFKTLFASSAGYFYVL